MILPNKNVKPEDSLIYISSNILKILIGHKLSIDDLSERLSNSQCKEISLEKLVLSLNYLYIIGKVEIQDDIAKVKLR